MTQKPKKKFNRNRNKSKKKTGGQAPIPANTTQNKKEVPAEPKKVIEIKKEQPAYADFKARKPQVYNYITFDTFPQAHQSIEAIKSACETCDRLNIIIKAEGDMEDNKLTSISKKIQIYAGEAWYLIHTRRLEEDWYKTTH